MNSPSTCWQHLNVKDRALLDAHGGERVVAVRPSLVRALRGRGNAAILLSQFLYWSARTKDPDGWFYNTQRELEEQTGLAEDAQLNARKLLVHLELLEERRVSIPARLEYRLKLAAIIELICSISGQNVDSDHTPKQSAGHGQGPDSDHTPNHYIESNKDSQRHTQRGAGAQSQTERTTAEAVGLYETLHEKIFKKRLPMHIPGQTLVESVCAEGGFDMEIWRGVLERSFGNGRDNPGTIVSMYREQRAYYKGRQQQAQQPRLAPHHKPDTSLSGDALIAVQEERKARFYGTRTN